LSKEAEQGAAGGRRRRSRTARAVTATLAIATLMTAQARAQSPYDALLAPPTACPGSDVPTILAANQEGEMLCLIDYARAASGVPALNRSPLLAWSAAIKADDIIRCEDFSHTACDRDPDAPFRQSGYAAPGVASETTENLATGTGLFGTPRAVMGEWLADGPHRMAILDPRWRDDGVAMRKPPALAGLTDAAVWVAHFGYRGSAPAALTSLRLTARPARPRARRRTRYSFVVTGVTAGKRTPVAGATVRFADRRARTDARGRATIVTSIRRPRAVTALAFIGLLRAKRLVRVWR
jgi:uncharacterized protein YkwD